MSEAPDRRVCPFVHDNDARCAQRFTLQRLGEVFHFCLGHPEECIVFCELTRHGQRIQRQRLAQAG